MADAPDTITAEESVVGHEDGDVLSSQEVVVYDYDEDGQFVGWHKELSK